jgi:uncharacterized protein (TIGR03086 family)
MRRILMADPEGNEFDLLWRNSTCCREGINDMPDLMPATGVLSHVVAGVAEDQLGAQTPCRGMTVADLLDHVDGLCMAFTAAAAKDVAAASQPPSPDGARLGIDWRTRITDRLARLGAAWQDEDAWTGTTRVGGLDMPAEVAGSVAINEVVVHGWDIAAATGQDYSGEPELLAAAYAFVQSAVEKNPDGSPGLFGAPVAVPDNAPVLDRLIGLTGRDPAWRRG